MSAALSNEDMFRAFDLAQLPIGAYCVAPNGEFLFGSRSVRQLLGLPLEGPLEANIAAFYADQSYRSVLLNKAINAESRGGYLEREVIHLRVQEHDVYIEDYCKPLRDPDSREIVGYIGCLVDVTAEREAKQREEELKAKNSELTMDIGRVLHANSSTLMMVKQTLDGAALALGPGPFKDLSVPSADEAEATVMERVEQLAKAIEHLLQKTEDERRLQALPEAQWALLAAQVLDLREFRKRIKVAEFRMPALRTAAHQIIEIGRTVTPGILPRELVREVISEAQQLERLTSLIAVLTTRLAVIQMDLTLRTLRDFVTSDVRMKEERHRVPVRALIQEAIAQMVEFARSSKVEIAWHDQSAAAIVEGYERDLVRVLANLLHNAIKYTWRRERTRLPWVTIRVKRQDERVCIEFENWGVPISHDELHDGLIFQLGYRGKWATDRGRLGTGIGLTDTQRVARAHGGEVYVESKPAHPSDMRPDEDDYYRQPFLTTVALCLPAVNEY